jgi:hypothetical protein
VQIFPALKTGRLEIVHHAMVRELIRGANGQVAAVSVHRQDNAAGEAGPLPDGRAGGERLRVGTDSAQLERPGELVRGGGSI